MDTMLNAEESKLIFAIENIAVINRNYQTPMSQLPNKQRFKQKWLLAGILGIPKNALKLPAKIASQYLFKFYILN